MTPAVVYLNEAMKTISKACLFFLRKDFARTKTLASKHYPTKQN